ncbi:MAG: class I SAM-dependent methyltransferase [bacterium]|nr:class I SAM-dependent methyltransferase [bacterium]
MPVSDKINHIRQLENSGKLAEAILRLESLIEAHPEMDELYPMVCKLYVKVGKVDVSPEWIMKAMKVDKGFEKWLNEMSQTQDIECTEEPHSRNVEYINCDFCGENDYEIVYQENPSNVVKCKSCGLVSFNPQPSEDDLKNYYNIFHDESISNIDSNILPRILSRKGQLKEIEQYITNKGKILDIGCANGEFLKAAQEEGWKVKGFETCPETANYAIEKLGLDVVIGSNFVDAGFSANEFDVITMQHVIEHLKNPLSTLKEVHKAIKSNGLLWISTPNFDSFMAKAQGIRWEWKAWPNHLYYFTPNTMRKYLEKTGFEILKLYARSAGGSIETYIKLIQERLFIDDSKTALQVIEYLDKLDINMGFEMVAIAKKL